MSIPEPVKFKIPFAESGLKNSIPQNANNTTGKAGFDKGFPERTMLPKASGGIPPSGMDFNGILYDITSAVRYMQAGGRPTYDAAFAAAIGGYPAGAVLISNDGSSVFQNIAPGNETDPNSGGAGWARPDLQMMELYRRSYAEAGYNLVDGSFEVGGTLTNASDVLLHEASGKAFSGPAGVVPPGTNPAVGGFVDRSGVGKNYTSITDMLTNALPTAVIGDIISTGVTKWRVVSNSAPVIQDNFIPLNGVWVSDNGAVLDGVADDTSALNGVFTLCAAKQYTVRAEGVALVSGTVEIKSNFSCGGAFTILRSASFVGDLTVTTAVSNLKIKGVRVRSQSSKTGRGFSVLTNNVKLTNIDIDNFNIGLSIRSFSCRVINCKSVMCNTNVSMAQLNGANEINAIVIDGGEYYGAVEYAFVIGDQRDSNPVETHGVNIKLINTPTLDTGCILIDKVIQVKISAYFENLYSTMQNAYIQINNTDLTTQNVEIANCNVVGDLASNGEYFVKVIEACRGLSVHDNQISRVPKCIVKTNSDIYPIHYQNNQLTSCSAGYPIVGLGVRAGQHNNAASLHTIDAYGLDQGEPTFKSIYAYNNVSKPIIGLDRGMRHTCVNGVGLYRLTNRGSAAITVVDNKTVSFNTVTDSGKFNGGECVVIGSNTAMIRDVDYDAGIAILDFYTLTTETTLQHKDPVIIAEFWTFSQPTTTEYAPGSIAWNTFANTSTPNYWRYSASGVWSPV